jgi:hypothetical protein
MLLRICYETKIKLETSVILIIPFIIVVIIIVVIVKGHDMRGRLGELAPHYPLKSLCVKAHFAYSSRE